MSFCDLGLAHLHDRALAELLFDLRQRGGERLALVVVHVQHSRGSMVDEVVPGWDCADYGTNDRSMEAARRPILGRWGARRTRRGSRAPRPRVRAARRRPFRNGRPPGAAKCRVATERSAVAAQRSTPFRPASRRPSARAGDAVIATAQCARLSSERPPPWRWRPLRRPRRSPRGPCGTPSISSSLRWSTCEASVEPFRASRDPGDCAGNEAAGARFGGATRHCRAPSARPSMPRGSCLVLRAFRGSRPLVIRVRVANPNLR